MRRDDAVRWDKVVVPPKRVKVPERMDLTRPAFPL